MKLTQADMVTATWLRIREQLEERLEALRRKNDHALSEIETSRIRGRIAEIKSLLEPEVEQNEAIDLTELDRLGQ